MCRRVRACVCVFVVECTLACKCISYEYGRYCYKSDACAFISVLCISDLHSPSQRLCVCVCVCEHVHIYMSAACVSIINLWHDFDVQCRVQYVRFFMPVSPGFVFTV